MLGSGFMILLLVSNIILYLAILIKLNPRVGFGIFLLGYFSLQAIGYFSYSLGDSRYLGMVFTAFILLVAIAATIANHVYLHNRLNVPIKILKSSVSADYLTAFVIFSISIYHIAALGFPLLREDVEISRFSFSDSGFFGIPSRVFLIALPLLMIYLNISFLINKRLSRNFIILAWCIYLALQLLSGFKGALLVAVVIFSVMWIVIKGSVRLKSLFSPLMILSASVSLLAAMVISFLYQTREISGIFDSFLYIVNRATIEQVSAGVFLIENYHRVQGEGLIVGDLKYFLQSYFGISQNNTPPLPLDKLISSRITNTPISGEFFIVSVTTGLFPIIYVEYGVYFTMLAGVMIGLATGVAIRCVRGYDYSHGALVPAILIFSLYNTLVVISNGNLIYWIINSTVGTCIFVLVHQLSCIILNRPRKKIC